ncbi:MAG: holdfast anchor protein HfaD [Hyphomonadaceae bacterium]|nr:holdfast anchor protein HfaD [Hyphomonadaceae bacterium]
MRALLLASAALIAAPLAHAQTVSNNQFDAGGASADIEANVDSAYDVGVTSVAGANAYTVVGDDIVLDNSQHADGAVDADTVASVGSAGHGVVATSAAVANGLTSEGGLELRSTQLSHADATATTTNDTGYVGYAASSSSASANVAALSAEAEDITAILTQESTGTTFAHTIGDHWGSDGQVVADAIASANNITAAGSTTTMLTDTTQSARGDNVTAEVDLYAGFAGDAVANATANANALTIENQYGYLNARVSQENTANVDARSYVTLGGDFPGFASAAAYGVGNQAMISNTTSDTDMNTVQWNGGDIYADAGLIADGAGDQALVSSAAYGNVVTGSLCGSDCGGDQATLTAANDQYNGGAVHARASISAQHANTAAGSAVAIGNAATYQVSNPGGY